MAAETVGHFDFASQMIVGSAYRNSFSLLPTHNDFLKVTKIT